MNLHDYGPMFCGSMVCRRCGVTFYARIAIEGRDVVPAVWTLRTWGGFRRSRRYLQCRPRRRK